MGVYLKCLNITNGCLHLKEVFLFSKLRKFVNFGLWRCGLSAILSFYVL